TAPVHDGHQRVPSNVALEQLRVQLASNGLVPTSTAVGGARLNPADFQPVQESVFLPSSVNLPPDAFNITPGSNGNSRTSTPTGSRRRIIPGAAALFVKQPDGTYVQNVAPGQ